MIIAMALYYYGDTLENESEGDIGTKSSELKKITLQRGEGPGGRGLEMPGHVALQRRVREAH